MKKGNGSEKIPVCEHTLTHNDVIERRRQDMPEEETLYNLADFFKIFGDSTRIRILFAIEREPLCVCDIAELLGMTKSAVSHQLKSFCQSNLITYRKQGKNVFYTLADSHVSDIIEKALEHINE
jgi:ArsR family transcriptional regulator